MASRGGGGGRGGGGLVPRGPGQAGFIFIFLYRKSVGDPGF